MIKPNGISQRLLNSLKSFGGLFSRNESAEPMKPISKKERKKRNKIQEIRAESRRKNRPVKKNRPVPISPGSPNRPLSNPIGPKDGLGSSGYWEYPWTWTVG